MAEPKTKATKQSVASFLKTVTDEQKLADAKAVIAMMREVTKCEPVLWGTSIIGFGTYRYKYATGREGDWPIVGLSPRKTNLTLYIMPGFDAYEGLLAKLGKHSTGSSCLYIKRLADVDTAVLKKLITQSVAAMKKRYKQP
jgi:Domain of unknown function (DU1801)